MEISKISCDIETYSSVNLQKAGVYKYAQSDDFEILLFAYSVNDSEVKVVDLANGERIPSNIIKALKDNSVIKWAFNAQFERVCLSRFLNLPESEYLNPVSWRCTMVWSATLGLPLSLEGVGSVLGLEKQKLKQGKELIKYFCVPCTPTKTNGYRSRNLPKYDMNKWLDFKNYNIRDVEVEMEIAKKLYKFPVSDALWNEYHLDQIINDRGILVDTKFVDNAIAIHNQTREDLMKEISKITGLDNPNSVIQLREWLKDYGVEAESLDKSSVNALLKVVNDKVANVLKIRQQLSKSSVKKYEAMKTVACSDNRCRGMFQFLGANRTGRFSGKLVQLQNLPKNYISDLEESRSLVVSGNTDAIQILYDDIPGLLSELIRTAFIPKENHLFYVVDFSAIEARVIAWLAKEKWREELFEKGGDIYCMSASQMFGVPVEKHGVNSELRQKGKVAELACIAEGELVLTNQGLIPIEEVELSHKLWDGVNWVKHDGVIYKGEREVIEYDGLKATSDHLVFVEGKQEPIQFGKAAAKLQNIIQSGNGRKTIWVGGDNRTIPNSSKRETEKLAINRGKARVYDIRNAGPYHRFTVSNKLVHNCGYGGSAGALTAMGALDMGLKEEELKPLVDAWRSANPNIVALWWAVDKCVKQTVKQKISTKTHGISFSYQSGILFITLPSGRKLVYIKPRIGINKFGGESVTYEGVGVAKKWERIESYGPKFVENIVQAIARDILVYAMMNLKDYRIVAHVHDEVIIESDNASLDEICNIMRKVPPWANGLILYADGYSCKFYKKD